MSFHAFCRLPQVRFARGIPEMQYYGSQTNRRTAFEERLQRLYGNVERCNIKFDRPGEFLTHMSEAHALRPRPSKRLLPSKPRPPKAVNVEPAEVMARFAYTWFHYPGDIRVLRTGQYWCDAAERDCVWVVPDDEPGCLIKLRPRNGGYTQEEIQYPRRDNKDDRNVA